MRKTKQRAIENHHLYLYISNVIASVFAEKTKPLYPWDMYPNLFQEEKREIDKEKAREEYESFLEGRRRFAERHNSRMKE